MPSRSVYPLKAATTADSAVRSVTSRRSARARIQSANKAPEGPSVGPSSLNVFVLQRRVRTGRLRIGPRHSRRGNSRVTLFAAAVRRSTAGWPPSGTVPTKVNFWRPRCRKSGSRIRAAVSNHTVRLPSSAKPPARERGLGTSLAC